MILIILLIGAFLSGISCSVSGPIYPIEAERRSISDLWIGFIFAIDPAFSFITSLFVGKWME